MHSEIATILIAFLAAANCSLVGNFLLLRKQAMIGDAISHAVLPGIVVAFMLGNSTHPAFLLAGAAVAGIMATIFIAFLREQIGLSHGTAIGIAFTSFFALGVFLLSMYVQQVDLDQGCVLYGELASAHFSLLVWNGMEMGPTALYMLLGLLLVNVLFLYICYPMLVITSFDKEFAASVGVSTQQWNYGFIMLTATNIVLLFRIVGAPLVIGFLTVPAATAYLFNNRLPAMLFFTLIIDAIIAINGFLVAMVLEASVAGAMMLVAGVLFVVIFLATLYCVPKQIKHPVTIKK